jgi:O-antigen/teichoic acid export membrane protein
VQAILVAGMVHACLQLVFLFIYMKRGFGSFFGRLDFDLLRQQLAYALPLGLAAWLYFLQTDSHHYFVARAFGPATYAIYAIGCASIPLIAVFGESMASVIIHRVSQLHSEGRRDDIVIVLRQAMANLAACYLPLYGLFLVVGRDLIAVVYTPKFLASWPIFAINLTLLPLAILGVVNDAAIRSYKECRAFLVWMRLALVVLLLAGLWFLTPRYGPIAAVSIMVAVNGLERLLSAGRVVRALNLGWRDASLLKGLIGIAATAFSAAAATFITRLALHGLGHGATLIICMLVFTATYIAASIVRLRAVGESAISEWPFAVLPEPARHAVQDLVTRMRPAHESAAAGEEAA